MPAVWFWIKSLHSSKPSCPHLSLNNIYSRPPLICGVTFYSFNDPCFTEVQKHEMKNSRNKTIHKFSIACCSESHDEILWHFTLSRPGRESSLCPVCPRCRCSPAHLAPSSRLGQGHCHGIAVLVFTQPSFYLTATRSAGPARLASRICHREAVKCFL